MNAEQKRFYNEVIKPRIIEMAIDGSLPMDMNELHWDYFEEKANEFNKSESEVRFKQIETLGHYLSEDDMDDALTRLENARDDDTMNDVVTMCEACEDMGWMTVASFWKNYM